ncbi:hypothetical protein LXL04_022448 [Taraxacum kok-saghyz]
MGQVTDVDPVSFPFTGKRKTELGVKRRTSSHGEVDRFNRGGLMRAVQMRTIIGGGNGGTNLGHLFQFVADQFSDAGALLSAQHMNRIMYIYTFIMSQCNTISTNDLKNPDRGILMLVQVRTIIKFENGGTNLARYKSHSQDLLRTHIFPRTRELPNHGEHLSPRR